MVLLFRTALSLCLAAGAAAVACTPEEDPDPYVRANAPIETDRGYFVLELRAAEGRSWPEYVGPTTLAARIELGDPGDEDEALQPPLSLTVEASEWLTAKAWPVTPDGFKWMMGLDFAAAGDWTLPVTIRDALGRSDEATLVFHIEAQPD